MKRSMVVVLVSIGLFMLGGCGGGGGESESVPVDTTPPSIVSLNPTDGTVDVDIDTIIQATFDENIDPSTVNGNSFIITNNNISIPCTLNISGVTVTAIPSISLLYNSTYNCELNTEIKDLSGNHLVSTIAWNFTTGAQPDTTPPTVTSTKPPSGTLNVLRTDPIQITFSEAIDCGTAGPNALSVAPSVAGSLECTGNQLIFKPTAPLLADTLHTAMISTVITDFAANPLPAIYSWSFNTGKEFAWAKNFSLGYIVPSAVLKTADGGYILAGYASGATYSYAFWAVKLDALGNVLWQKAYDGFGDFAFTVEQTSDGGYIIGGTSWQFGTSGSQDAWIVKTDANGNPTWHKAYGTSLVGQRILSIEQTLDGGYIAAGYWYMSSGTRAWVMKLSSTGSVTWQKSYGVGETEEAYSIKQTADGGYIFAGYSEITNIDSDAWVVKLTSTGNITWQIVYGDLNVADQANDIVQTSDGKYTFTGHTASSGAGGSDVWVVHLDTDGSVLWQNTYGGASDEVAKSIRETPDGGYIVAGYTNSFGSSGQDVLVMKLDSSGDISWQRRYGGSSDDEGVSIDVADDGGYVLAANSDSFAYGAMWVLKLSSQGQVSFADGSGAVQVDTSVVRQASNVNVSVTGGTALNSGALTRNTACPVTDTSATITYQAP